MEFQLKPQIPNCIILLRWPGSKTKAVNIIMKYVPEYVNHVISPFIGGGSIELACIRRHIKVSGYDISPQLVNFWKHALKMPHEMADVVQKKYSKFSREQYHTLLHKYESYEPLESAAAFFALNRSSFSGVMAGWSGETKISKGMINRLRKFSAPGLSVECVDFSKSIPTAESDDFMYLDPPYVGNDSYYRMNNDKPKLDHELLAKLLYKTKAKWILSYNDVPYVRGII